jgi:predicted nucleic acid-binding protein
VSAISILKNNDHEDALQLAIAERIGCSHIVTLDREFSLIYRDRINFINPANI